MTDLFETLGCGRVELKTDANNAQSRAAILRLGAVEEGTLRRHMVRERGLRRDTVYYSVIAEEWPAVRARLEGMLEARDADADRSGPQPGGTGATTRPRP